MGNVIISLVIIFSIIIQKFESNVTNKEIIDKVQRFHDSVKKHFQKISDSPINKKIVSNWLAGLFVLLAIINYVSVLIFGNNSENTLLNNHKILYSIIPFILVLSGYLSNRWHIILLILLSIMFLIVLFFNDKYNPLIIKTNNLYKAIVVITILIIIFIIYHFILKWLAIIFHFLLKKYFKFCLYLNPEKPLKPFVVIIDILFILLIPIFNLF